MEIKLINGDCSIELQNLDLSKTIFVSDPPFNVGYHYNSYKDKMDEDEYHEWLCNIFGKHMHVLIHYPEALHRHTFTIGRFPDKIVTWVYNSNLPRQHRDIAFYGVNPNFRKVGQPYKNTKDKRVQKLIAEGKMARLYDWWEINQVKNVSSEKSIHPCQMPQKVMDNIIGILPEDYTIVDPFMGSGSTGIACVKYNRNFIGIEIDELYFNEAKQRINESINEQTTNNLTL